MTGIYDHLTQQRLQAIAEAERQQAQLLDEINKYWSQFDVPELVPTGLAEYESQLQSLIETFEATQAQTQTEIEKFASILDGPEIRSPLADAGTIQPRPKSSVITDILNGPNIDLRPTIPIN